MLRVVFWVVVICALTAFSIANWVPVEVRIWDGLMLETRLPALVIGALVFGFMPMWFMYRATRWRLSRRIKTLETSLYTRAAPSLSSTNLEAAQTQLTQSETP